MTTSPPTRRIYGGNHNANKTHCAHGHLLSGNNVCIRHRIRGGYLCVERRCLACKQYERKGNNVRRGRR